MRSLCLLLLAFSSHHSFAQDLSGPEMCLGHLHKGDSIQQSDLSQALPIHICNDKDRLVTVFSYSLSRFAKGMDPVEKFATGNTLEGDVLAIVMKAPTGAKLYLHNVKGVRADGRIVMLSGLMLIKK
jgi:hypothetical protein